MGKVRKPRPNRRPVTVLEDSPEEPEVVDSKENALHTILDQLQVSFIITYKVRNLVIFRVKNL